MAKNPQLLAKKWASLLQSLSYEQWQQILQQEPEWRLSQRLGSWLFGPRATFLLLVGLNAYQLKGAAEQFYWARLETLVQDTLSPCHLQELRGLLREFYRFERLHNQKLKRLDRFLSSPLAAQLWSSTPSWVCQNFRAIWQELCAVMRAKLSQKTIVFSLKCLAIGTLQEYPQAEFAEIPIPVDSRVRKFSEKLGLPGASAATIQKFWAQVLAQLQRRYPISMLHLDSLIWQIGNLSPAELQAYFHQLGMPELGKKLWRHLALT